ncbi:Signal transduction histidine kinase [Fontibacillus panacisegetis]|uniref:histidine kinase n=2 Tax=Fontibacillus panacisegetis TaxID=670482 RepID=A0A1G7R3F6_9BACL|nr:Signal transduction histidine kinase [Fontibacillus panacisegetis]
MQDMKVLYRVLFSIVVLIIVAFCIFLLEVPENNHVDEHVINQWQIKWVSELDSNITTDQLDAMDGWIDVDGSNSVTERTQGDSAQWVKFELPDLNEKAAAIFFERIYGTHVVVKVDGVDIYDNVSNFALSYNTVLLPLSVINSHQKVYVGLERNDSSIGIVKQIKVGKYQDMIRGFISNNTATYILGSTLIFIALIMLVCSLFLYTGNLSMWLSLCAVILSSGFLVITYSPLPAWLHQSMRGMYSVLFDISLYILLPTFTFFFEKTFGSGLHSIVRRFRIFQTIYSCFCLVCFLLLVISNFQVLLYGFYYIVSLQVLGIIMIVQFILLICFSTKYAVQGDKNAIIFSMGFIIFALIGIGELLYYYIVDPYYSLFLWKWGIVCFLISLIIILGRKFSENHKRIVQYTKQLEMFNNELQRSERMEIISELAASVAHEVRNPLQVTRGFIQLLLERQPSEKVYLNMAMHELDRASEIITDYLTFAKPEAGVITNLNILDEFIHIEGILIPMANMQGGEISVHIPNDIYIRGNSSKFKQAFINIIKNSIESLQGEGEIQIWAYEEGEKVHIHIKDNGEGMEAEVLARLGEPYFTNKTKGTGLGLMVTLRIIEVMEGSIKFASEKGIGTEVIIQFPKVCISTIE